MRIAIIGAGICGLYLAWKLAERREEVAVFEKRNKIGKEACSGLFSDRILEFIPQSKNLIQNQIDYALIHFPRKTLKIIFTRNFFVIRHAELDMIIADLARAAGAKIILNSNISRLNLYRLKKDFDRVIGCDGALSETRKSLELKTPEFYSAIQGFVKEIDNSNFVETWATESGFIWRVPRGGETEWGIMEKPKDARLLFDEFLKKSNIRLEGLKSALIPQGLIVPSSPKITLCGDASGLTKSWSGGGVIWGLTAANLLLKTFPDFIQYQKELKKFFLREIASAKLIKKAVYFFGFNLPWVLPNNYQIDGDFLR